MKYLSIRIVDVSIPDVYRKTQKQENVIDDNCVKSTVLRAKKIIGKHIIAFSVKTSVLQIRST